MEKTPLREGRASSSASSSAGCASSAAGCASSAAPPAGAPPTAAPRARRAVAGLAPATSAAHNSPRRSSALAPA